MLRSPLSLFRAAAVSLASLRHFFAPLPAKADAGFQQWVAGFYSTAAKSGISAGTYSAAFRGVTAPDPVVLEKARFQPEFTTKVWDYLDSRVNPYTIAKGREMGAQHARTLCSH
jgi:membrane-bound lytic murein transglycosylase B